MSQANVHKIVSRFRRVRPRRSSHDLSLTMADDVKKLLSEYIAEHRAGGEADPLAYLERAGDADRAELAALIDGYLARSPGREWDAEAYKGSAAERVAESVGRSLLGAAGMWPAVLPRLRHQARLTRNAGRRAAERGARRAWPRSQGRAATTTRWSTASSTRGASRPACSRRSARSTGRRPRSCARSASRRAPAPPAAGGAPAPAMARTAMPDARLRHRPRTATNSDPSRWRRRRRETRSTRLFTGGP